MNDSDSLVGHLFDSAIKGLTVRACFDLLALGNDLLEDSSSLLRIHPGLIHMNVF